MAVLVKAKKSANKISSGDGNGVNDVVEAVEFDEVLVLLTIPPGNSLSLSGMGSPVGMSASGVGVGPSNYKMVNANDDRFKFSNFVFRQEVVANQWSKH